MRKQFWFTLDMVKHTWVPDTVIFYDKEPEDSSSGFWATHGPFKTLLEAKTQAINDIQGYINDLETLKESVNKSTLSKP